MSSSHSPDHEHARAPRPARPARRTAAVLAGLVLVATVPFVARALDADVTPDDRITTADPAPSVDPSTAVGATPAATTPALPDPYDRPIPRDPIPATPVANPVDSAGADGTATPDENGALTDAPVDAVADEAADPAGLLTDPYAWDERSPRVAELQRALGVSDDGWYGATTRRAHLAALAEAGLPVDAVPDVPGPDAASWEALRQCESGGDYSIVSRSGTYRGAYQFNRTTWDSVAGRHAPELVGVDPADASPADQDAMALALYGERGAQPWPHCGRHLR